MQAPIGYRITSGVCNDDERGWECDYSQAVVAPGRQLSDEELLDEMNSRRTTTIAGSFAGGNKGGNKGGTKNTPAESKLGIQSGRSTTCVFVDRQGKVQAPINFGIMKEGDTRSVGTNVALVLEFDGAGATAGGRRLSEILSRALVMDEVDNGVEVTTRYLLAETDKQAIGTVTAEVLASTLDGRLAENGVELDSVDPKDVILSNTRPSDAAVSAASAGSQLAVASKLPTANNHLASSAESYHFHALCFSLSS